MKILVDAMYDDMEIKLRGLGFDAESAKKLSEKESKLGNDFNVIRYAQENNMVLITNDKENGKACKANGFPCVWVNPESIFEKMIVPELQKMRTSN